MKNQLYNKWTWEDCNLLSVDDSFPINRFQIEYTNSEGMSCLKQVSRLNLYLCDFEDFDKFLERRKVALEMREIHLSVVRYAVQV